MSLILEKFDDYDMSLQNVIIAQRIQSSERQYQGLLPLVLKGLYHERSHDDAIHLISHMVVIPGDYLFHHHTSVRLAVNIFGLLPFMCTHIRDAQQEECFQMARNISMACENTKLPKIAKVFIRYANGHYGQADSFLIDLKKPFVDTIFRQSEDEIYTLIQNLLEYGPSSYVKALLEITYSLLPTELSKSLLLQRENFGYVSTITSILEQPLWADANRVLDVLVRSSITGTKVRLNSTAVGNQQRRSKMSNSEFFQQQSGGDKNVIDLLSVLVKEKPNIQEKRRDSSKEATSADGDASSDEFTEDSTETMTETNDDGTTTFRTSSNEKEETLLKQFNDFLAKALKTGNPN